MTTKTKVPVRFFSNQLFDSGKRIAPSKTSAKISLNRNESAFELNMDFKKEILYRVQDTDWKNYPSPYYPDIEKLIASYLGVRKGQVVPAAGSANIITVMLNYAAIQKHQIVIASPSFSLYEFHCKSYSIDYNTWPLNSDLEYDFDLLPQIKPNALILFASPNNPVGNVITKDKMQKMLQKFPEAYFLVDEVYAEFSDINLLPLLEQYPNLLLLRSFSKSFSAAGLRIGYLIAKEEIVNQVRKLILPFSLNCLSAEYIRKVLTNNRILAQQQLNIEWIKTEKLRVESAIKALDPEESFLRVHPTFGNFILFFFKNEGIFQLFKSRLLESEIELLDLSSHPAMPFAIRMTIGAMKENDAVIDIFQKLF